MIFYPDKRNRYANVFPWDFSVGVGRASNTPQTEPRVDTAKREVTPGEHFRKTTAMQEVPAPSNADTSSGGVGFQTATETKQTEAPAVPSEPLPRP